MFYNKYMIAFLLTITECVHSLTLKGVTITSPPFVMSGENSHYEGFAIDLMDEISKIAKFNYTLYPSPDETYGSTDSGKPTGMIQELFLRRADFAVSDLTKNQVRERYIDFTEPFMTLDLSALIHKKNIGNMTSFEDLVNQNNITYGTLREGATFRFMSTSSDETIRRIYQFIYRNGYNLVNSKQDGIERVLNSNYAFIQESVANDYARDENCELTVIDAEKEYYKREYAIGLQKQSTHLDSFNKAIRQLKNEGVLEKLRQKYWNTNCLSNSDMISVNAKINFITSFSLILYAVISYILFN